MTIAFGTAARRIIGSNLPFSDMTMRQIAILAYISENSGHATVRGMSAALNLTKPVITRALDTMGRMNLIQRQRDPRDRRNVFAKITHQGANALLALDALLQP